MRRISAMCIVLILLVIATGCLQAPTANPAPAPLTVTAALPAVSATLPPAVLPTTSLPKNVTFNVTRSTKSVNVTYNGGPDAVSLLSITIRITNHDGTKFDPRTIKNPVIGNMYVFTYQTMANPAVVNIVGNFSDGTQQTLLIQYL